MASPDMYEETFSHTNLTNEWYLVRLRATEVNNDATFLHGPVFYVKQIFLYGCNSFIGFSETDPLENH